ncbi:MAG: GNAT family N-acetyltransferase [Caldiserica bacterium]|nr:GNAT family N-acetyltransferase [Caldisericota bacterium]MDH7562041.1 GNAT family N-acetyltransferase [Caldisericota bacterium]
MRKRSQVFPPFIFGKNYYRTNWDLIIALIPAFLAGSLSYGIGPSFLFLTLSVLGAVFAEVIFSFALSQSFSLDDGWAISMGFLSALVLPPNSPLYIPVLVAAFAVLLGKVIPGGLGRSVFHPLILSLILVFFLFPGVLTYKWPALEESGQTVVRTKEWYQLLLLSSGNQALGSYSFLAIILGGIYLALRRSLNTLVSLSYLLGSVFFLIFSQVPVLSQFVANDALFFGVFVVPLSGTTPLTLKGKLAFGVLGGLISIPFRLIFGPVLGIIFSLPFANATVPLWNFLFLPKARNFLFQPPKPITGKAFSSLRGFFGVLKGWKPFSKFPVREKPPEKGPEIEPAFSSNFKCSPFQGDPSQFCSFCTEPLKECQDFLASAQKKGWRFFSLSDNSGVQGGVILGKAEDSPFPANGDDFWVLACLRVRQEHRGKGLGRELLDYAFQAVEDSSGLFALSHNSLIPPAFLDKMGFIMVDKRGEWGLHLKSLKEGAVNFLEAEEGGEEKGEVILEAVLPPYCSLFLKNYREAVLALGLSQERFGFKEHLIFKREDFKQYPVWGIYLKGKLLKTGLVESEKLKETILKGLEEQAS